MKSLPGSEWRTAFFLFYSNITIKTHLFWTLQVSSKTNQQLMRNGVHQVKKSSIFVQNVIE